MKINKRTKVVDSKYGEGLILVQNDAITNSVSHVRLNEDFEVKDDKYDKKLQLVQKDSITGKTNVISLSTEEVQEVENIILRYKLSLRIKSERGDKQMIKAKEEYKELNRPEKNKTDFYSELRTEQSKVDKITESPKEVIPILKQGGKFIAKYTGDEDFNLFGKITWQSGGSGGINVDGSGGYGEYFPFNETGDIRVTQIAIDEANIWATPSKYDLASRRVTRVIWNSNEYLSKEEVKKLSNIPEDEIFNRVLNDLKYGDLIGYDRSKEVYYDKLY